MNLEQRRDQFTFFLGYVSKNNRNQLNEAIKYLIDQGYNHIKPEDVFDDCPFNDNIEQILRSFHIFQNGKNNDLSLKLFNLIEEFTFLVSDFETPCCGDGKAFYCQNNAKEISLECDRCSSYYNLDGNLLKDAQDRKMIKADFETHFGKATAGLWPLHSELKMLVSNE